MRSQKVAAGVAPPTTVLGLPAMATTNPTDHRRTANRTTSSDSDTVRHSKADAVDDRQFELLVEATYDMDRYYGLQSRFVLFVAGRLGLRAGEIAHMTEDWIDYRRSMICIPHHKECTTGRDGTMCGHCRQHARQKAEVRSRQAYDKAHGSLGSQAVLEPAGREAVDAHVSEEQMYHRQWTPKTEAASREIAFDAVTRADIVIHRFFDRFDEWPHSIQAVNRRVKRMARKADGVDPDDLYPHALRSTAANFWAAHQIGPHALKSLMGWAQLSTSRAYISDNGERTAQAMRDVVM